MATQQVNTADDVAAASATDIQFDCPACGKSLVVDQAAEGMILDCPQCRTNVIVPPKSSKSEKDSRLLSEDSRLLSGMEPKPDDGVDSVTSGLRRAEAASSAQASTSEVREGLATPNAFGGSLQQRLSVLSGQLKEIQAQRTEVTGRIASRLNDVNRDLVIIARLETSQKQTLSEWNQWAGKISSHRAVIESDVAEPAVIGSSINRGGRTRVSFRQ